MSPGHSSNLVTCMLDWETYFLKGEGAGSIPYGDLYRRALPERGIFFRLKVYERVGIHVL